MENKDSIDKQNQNGLPEKIESLSIAEHNNKVEESPNNEEKNDKSVVTDDLSGGIESVDVLKEKPALHHEEVLDEKKNETVNTESENQEDRIENTENVLEDEPEPVFDGTEVSEADVARSSSTRSSDLDQEAQVSAWPDKAVAIKNFVKEKGVVAVSNVLRRLSGGKNGSGQSPPDSDEKEEELTPRDISTDVSKKPVERPAWNPLSFIKIVLDVDQTKVEQVEDSNTGDSLQPPTMKGRITLYTRLGCQDCKDVRLFLQSKRLIYVEINIDVYPSRKMELEKLTGSSTVPKVFFNEHSIGGFDELKAIDESSELDKKIEEIITKEPSSDTPLPPLSGEDDVSCSGTVDELAIIVKRMREGISVKDRFYKMRRFTNCFLGSEAVDFLSEDQYMEREEATELGRKLASKHFFRHVSHDNIFEDGNDLYRFLDQDPVVLSQCYNIPRGITDVEPKPVIEIASRLRLLSFAILEAYTSEDGKRVDYRSIHRSEEFARYLRVVEELQRVDLQDLPREEKIAFFINLYNMMVIHVIMLWGFPVGAMERRKMFGDFKYVVGGCTYSLSAIENGILRGNQRPPYNITKPFSAKDPRSKIALPYTEPLVHFALVCGTRSGPALRCYSPRDIDNQLMEAARNFLRNGGLVFYPATKGATASKILKWYSVDFGKNEGEVLKHAANYLEPERLEELLELITNTQLKVTYQPYDWGLNSV